MTKNGKRHEPLAPPAETKPTFSLISNEKLLELYTGLLRWRMIQGYAAERANQRTNSVGGGCEATLVAVAADMAAKDSTVCLDDHPLSWAVAGTPIEKLLKSPQSDDTSASAPQNHSMPTSGDEPETAASRQLNYLLGAALKNKIQNNGRIGVVLSGDRSVDALADSFKAAAECKLPIIFVVRESARGPRKQLALTDLDEAKLPVIGVDGNDAVASYRVAHEAIERARRGRGPTVIDARAYRVGFALNGHNSIRNMEEYLRSKGLMTTGLTRSIKEQLERELDSALKNG